MNISKKWKYQKTKHSTKKFRIFALQRYHIFNSMWKTHKVMTISKKVPKGASIFFVLYNMLNYFLMLLIFIHMLNHFLIYIDMLNYFFNIYGYSKFFLVFINLINYFFNIYWYSKLFFDIYRYDKLFF